MYMFNVKLCKHTIIINNYNYTDYNYNILQ